MYSSGGFVGDDEGGGQWVAHKPPTIVWRSLRSPRMRTWGFCALGIGVAQRQRTSQAWTTRGRSVNQEVKAKRKTPGGSEWESNPPRTLLMPLNGFEAREAHRSPVAPLQTKLDQYKSPRSSAQILDTLCNHCLCFIHPSGSAGSPLPPPQAVHPQPVHPQPISPHLRGFPSQNVSSA